MLTIFLVAQVNLEAVADSVGAEEEVTGADEVEEGAGLVVVVVEDVVEDSATVVVVEVRFPSTSRGRKESANHLVHAIL